MEELEKTGEAQEETPKPKKRWTTVHQDPHSIKVAGRRLVEQVVVQLEGYDIKLIAEGPDVATYQVGVTVTVGDADEAAVAKAFTALGKHVADDARARRIA